MVMYMYIATGQGQTTPWVKSFSLTVLFSHYSNLLQDFLHLMTVQKFSPFKRTGDPI